MLTGWYSFHTMVVSILSTSRKLESRGSSFCPSSRGCMRSAPTRMYAQKSANSTDVAATVSGCARNWQ